MIVVLYMKAMALVMTVGYESNCIWKFQFSFISLLFFFFFSKDANISLLNLTLKIEWFRHSMTDFYVKNLELSDSSPLTWVLFIYATRVGGPSPEGEKVYLANKPNTFVVFVNFVSSFPCWSGLLHYVWHGGREEREKKGETQQQ